MKKIVLVGGGGHCNSCIDVIEKLSNIKISAIIDNKPSIKMLFNKYKVYNEKYFSFNKYSNHFYLVTVGQIKSNLVRKKIFENLKKKNFKLIIIKSLNSIVSNYSNISEGSIIMNFAYIGANVEIGKNCIINNYASVEHDSKVGDHCHISTGVKINGNTTIGSNAFIGSGTVIDNNIIIGKNCVIGSGLRIKKNIKENSIVK